MILVGTVIYISNMTNGGMRPESCSTQVQQLREAFSVFDKSGDGKVRTNRRVMPDVLDSCRFNMPAKHALLRAHVT